jgi:hypothetical protein
MAFCSEGVDMKRLSAKKWYTKSAKQASTTLGAKGRELILAHMRDVLGAAPKKKESTSPRRRSGP